MQSNFVQSIIRFRGMVDNMRHNSSVDKESCLDSFDGILVSILARYVSEPFCTNFALPIESDCMPEEDILKQTQNILSPLLPSG